MIRVPNLYRHADGGLCCLLSDDAPLKEPTPVGIWHDGVIYLSTDGRMRSTTKARWGERFFPVLEIREDEVNEDEMAMIRRANPGDVDLDFRSAMESWHEAEIGVQSNMLELAVAVVMSAFAPLAEQIDPDDKTLEMTIRSSDLQRVLETYEIERVPLEDGFTLRLKKL